MSRVADYVDVFEARGYRLMANAGLLRERLPRRAVWQLVATNVVTPTHAKNQIAQRGFYCEPIPTNHHSRWYE
jgi:hypothetical protein